LNLLNEPLGQTSGVGEQPNSQDDWDNRPTVGSQDDWDNRPTVSTERAEGTNP
jgi:hypothetical protein